MFIGTINNSHDVSFPSAVHTTDTLARRKGVPSFEDLGTLFYEKAASGDDPEGVALVWQLYHEILGSSVALAAEAALGQQYKSVWQENENRIQSLRFELSCRKEEVQRLKKLIEKSGYLSCDDTEVELGLIGSKPHDFKEKMEHFDLSQNSPNSSSTIESIMDQTANTSPYSSKHSVRPHTSPDCNSSRYRISTFVNRLTRRKVRIYSEVDVVQPVWYPKSGGSVMTNGSVRTRYETGSIARFKVKLNPSTCDTVGQQTKEYRDWAVAKAERKYGELFNGDFS
ncbi:hypothetical protein CJU89_6360 [Yarrowia sp. B02]|nr:hypothetical protein CJU89_6360 [Yarrowia sp. B02]